MTLTSPDSQELVGKIIILVFIEVEHDILHRNGKICLILVDVYKFEAAIMNPQHNQPHKQKRLPQHVCLPCQHWELRMHAWRGGAAAEGDAIPHGPAQQRACGVKILILTRPSSQCYLYSSALSLPSSESRRQKRRLPFLYLGNISHRLMGIHTLCLHISKPASPSPSML